MKIYDEQGLMLVTKKCKYCNDEISASFDECDNCIGSYNLYRELIVYWKYTYKLSSNMSQKLRKTIDKVYDNIPVNVRINKAI